LTASASGFFAAEGRDVFRVKPSVLELDQMLTECDPGLGGQRVENVEMEASFLNHFLGALGHWSGAICVAVANRQKNTIAVNYQEAIRNATKVALLALALLRNRYPDVRLS
jgi:uridine phosphorylase